MATSMGLTANQKSLQVCWLIFDDFVFFNSCDLDSVTEKRLFDRPTAGILIQGGNHHEAQIKRSYSDTVVGRNSQLVLSVTLSVSTVWFRNPDGDLRNESGVDR